MSIWFSVLFVHGFGPLSQVLGFGSCKYDKCLKIQFLPRRKHTDSPFQRRID
jgi:hypothetical protein